jgi:cytoskeleton protein RodZ
MAEGKEKKKKAAANEDTQRPQNSSVGEILRAARMQKGLGLEEISSEIHIRVAQLRALEEGDISALPGMTYALGFVKSYASHLKLNGAEIVKKFKAEQAGAPTPQPLHFPEPIHERPRINFFVLGVAAFFAVLLLIVWAVFSGGEEKGMKMAEQIPVAPVVGTISGIDPIRSMPQVKTPPVAPPVVVSAVPAPAAPASGMSLAGSSLLANTATPPPTPEVLPIQTAADTAEDTGPVLLPLKPERSVRVESQDKQETQTEETPVIQIKRGKSRIVLHPLQPSWVQITDAEGQVILKKVLRPGDQFFVPDRPNLTLVTSNAGGLDILVDDQKVQALGKPGEIVRGVSLNPDSLKVVRIKARDR